MGERGHGSPLRALRDKRVVLLSLFYLCFPLGAYGLSFWLPTIVDGFGGLSTTATGFITPSRTSRGHRPVRRAETRGPQRYALPVDRGHRLALGLAASALTGNHVLQMGLHQRGRDVHLRGAAGAVVAPLTLPDGNSGGLRHRGDQRRGQSGGGFGPMGIGVVVDRTGSAVGGLWFLVAAMVIAAVATPGVRRLVEGGPVVAHAPDTSATATGRTKVSTPRN